MLEMKRPRIVKNGFTLIEIVLVLTIAGLLLVVVFLAVSGAQRSRRDMVRKTDLSLLFGAMEAYTSNHNGQPPMSQAQVDDVNANYFKNNGDPLLGTPYTLPYRAPGSPHSDVPPVGTIYYQ